jgi:enoyl-CoA hydratase/carnithine racemase
MDEAIRFSIDEKVGIIELARPAKFNCLSTRAWELLDGFRRECESGAARAIVIRAQGENFCTGADLDEISALGDDALALSAFIRRGHDALQALEQSPLPVIAAVQGLCLAGGLELMLAADVVFASRSARLGDQHARYGLVPGWGGSQRLPRTIGLRRALDLMFSARWLSAEEALAMGLVNHLAEDEALWHDAQDYAAKLTLLSRAGLAQMKRLARDGLALTPGAGLNLEAEAATLHLASADAAQGLAAFRERRKPQFP